MTLSSGLKEMYWCVCHPIWMWTATSVCCFSKWRPFWPMARLCHHSCWEIMTSSISPCGSVCQMHKLSLLNYVDQKDWSICRPPNSVMHSHTVLICAHGRWSSTITCQVRQFDWLVIIKWAIQCHSGFQKRLQKKQTNINRLDVKKFISYKQECWRLPTPQLVIDEVMCCLLSRQCYWPPLCSCKVNSRWSVSTLQCLAEWHLI